jgi:hypothetical protein
MLRFVLPGAHRRAYLFDRPLDEPDRPSDGPSWPAEHHLTRNVHQLSLCPLGWASVRECHMSAFAVGTTTGDSLRIQREVRATATQRDACGLARERLPARAVVVGIARRATSKRCHDPFTGPVRSNGEDPAHLIPRLT